MIKVIFRKKAAFYLTTSLDNLFAAASTFSILDSISSYITASSSLVERKWNWRKWTRI